MRNWYLVYTKPKNEDSVSEKLSACGFDVFNPKFRERKTVRRKIRDVTAPLFPCYLFVKLDLLRSHRLVKYTRGVRRFVGAEDSPIPVHQDIIDAIRARMEDGIVTLKSRRFSPGDDVEIKAGPFEGLGAVFVCERKGVERVSILLKEIGARVIVDGAILGKL